MRRALIFAAMLFASSANAQVTGLAYPTTSLVTELTHDWTPLGGFGALDVQIISGTANVMVVTQGNAQPDGLENGALLDHKWRPFFHDVGRCGYVWGRAARPGDHATVAVTPIAPDKTGDCASLGPQPN